MSYIGKSPSGSGVRTRYYFTQSSGGGTSISGTDDNGKTLTYTDGEYVDVYLNGVLLVHGTDYGTGTANTISSLAALASGDVVEVVVYDIFNVAKINNEAVRKRYYKTASGSETSISGADDSGATITFPANAEIEVKLNGVALVQGTDYNTTSANTVGGLSALSAGQVVEVVVYERFVLGDTVSKADGGTFAGNVGFSGNIDVDGTTTVDGLTSSEALDVTTSTHANASVFKSTGNTQIMLQDTDATANDQFWGLQVSGGDFNILTCNDDRASGFVTPLTIDSGGRIFMANQPAFSATASATNIPLTTSTTVTLSSERFDVGSHLASNTFTAPVTGKYLFTYLFYLTQLDADHTTFDVHIKTSNKQYQQTWNPSTFMSSDGNFSVSGSVIADMDVNDTCFYMVYCSGGAAQTDIHADSHVSGCLLL